MFGHEEHLKSWDGFALTLAILSRKNKGNGQLHMPQSPKGNRYPQKFYNTLSRGQPYHYAQGP